jgi:CBS domain-containing protein
MIGATMKPMKIKDSMTRRVEWIGLDATIRQAAEKMREAGVGMLPVCDAGRPIGVVTDRDIVVRAVAAGIDTQAHLVCEIMTPQVLTCFEEQPVDVATRIIETQGVRRLIVIDRDHRMVGIVTENDLATLPAETTPAAGEFLDHIH